jgi:hypothetical protein
MFKRTLQLASILLTLLAVGCGKSPPGSPPDIAESGSAQVTYKPTTRVLSEKDARGMILGISSNGAGLLLSGANAVAKNLKAGDVLLIKETAALKVIGARTLEDGNIIALTQRASLLDAVSDAHIKLNKPVRFGALTAANRPAPDRRTTLLDWVVPAAQAQSAEQSILNSHDQKGSDDAAKKVLSGIKGALIEGWTTDFSVTPGSDRVDITIKLTKDVGAFRAVITGEGYLQDFNMGADIDVEQSTYQKLQTGFKNLNGVMNIRWEVATQGPGVHTGDDRIKLPGAIEIPLYKMLDGFPLFLEISAALIIKPALSGGSEYSHGAFRITYDGYQNFSAKEGTIDSDGNVKGDIEFLESQNISPLAPMGMVVAMAAPRLELTFGVSKILKFDDMKDAAGKVDAATDFLAKELLTPDQYARFKASPVGQIGLSKAIDNALKSDAAAFIEFVASAGMSNTGASVITPCTRHDIHLWIKAGVSAEAFGQKVGESVKDLFSKDFKRIDPPGTHLCEEVGT